MSAERNKQLAHDTYAAASKGDVAAYLAGLAEDVEYTFFGKHRFGKTFRGKADILSNLLGPLMDRLEGGITLHPRNAIAEGDQVVIEFQGEDSTKDGLPYNNQYCMVLKLKDDKIVQIREYLDTDLAKSIFG
jgi:ketosteroid isomerase-like protein